MFIEVLHVLVFAPLASKDGFLISFNTVLLSRHLAEAKVGSVKDYREEKGFGFIVCPPWLQAGIKMLKF